mgnify:CR=1 FL=1
MAQDFLFYWVSGREFDHLAKSLVYLAIVRLEFIRLLKLYFRITKTQPCDKSRQYYDEKNLRYSLYLSLYL